MITKAKIKKIIEYHSPKPWTGQDFADFFYVNKDKLTLAEVFDVAIKIAENRGRQER